MIFRKGSPRRIALVAIVALIVGLGGWWVFKPAAKPGSQTSGPTSGQTQPGQTQPGQTSQPASTADLTLETDDFKYAEPVGWAKLSKDTLKASTASSGIGRVAAPSATFTVKVSPLTPADQADLKNHALDDIKNNAPHFELLSSISAKIDGQAGQKFTYRFDSSGQYKVKQELSAAVYKQKTFFLLFSAAESDFDRQQGEFTTILASFHFK